MLLLLMLVKFRVFLGEHCERSRLVEAVTDAIPEKLAPT